MTPTPKYLSIGIISLSSSRYVALCWFCIAMNGVRRLLIAYSTSVTVIPSSAGTQPSRCQFVNTNRTYAA